MSGTLSLSRELYDMISTLYSCVRVFYVLRVLYVILLCFPRSEKSVIMASHFYKRKIVVLEIRLKRLESIF